MESFQQIKNNSVDLISNNDPLDKNRLLIEDLWESVLREECPDDQAERLIQLKELSYSKQIDGDSSKTFKNEIVDIVNSMDLAESIAAARAFSLYFQLVNILELRVEEDRYIQSFTNMNVQKSPDNLDPFAPALARQNAPVTFRELFYRLRKLNVPPGKLEELLQEMDIRLVFTAHPTEIVRHTIRHKQTRVANLLKKIQVEQFLTIEEKNSLKTQLKEEVRLWWRTDELHQFKPSVLDEVDYALHYFQQVLFNAMPQLRCRIAEALTENYPDVQMPSESFCNFGSWVGSDRDCNPSGTPEITWRTACYQRQLMLERYIIAASNLRDQLSVSMQWSQVSSSLLESLETDRVKFPEIYEARATRYRSEPYRLKLSYILEKLRLTQERNNLLADSGWKFDLEGEIDTKNIDKVENLYYKSVNEFTYDLELIKNSLISTDLTCEAVNNLLTQVHIFGFSLASLDIRQESTRHSDAIQELTNYLDLSVQYDQMSEEEKIKWLVAELNTKRPLIPSDVNWKKTTEETFSVFKMVKRLQQEFGSRICHSYVISMSHSASDLLEVLLLALVM